MSVRADEAGGASLFAVACVAVLLLVGAALGVVAAMVHAHRQAQSAADLASLAAASAVADGGDGCRRGRGDRGCKRRQPRELSAARPRRQRHRHGGRAGVARSDG